MFETPDSFATEGPTVAKIRQGHSWYRDWVLLLTVPAVLALDQLSKYLIRTNLALGESWPADGLFRLTYGTNTGSAFGLFPNQTVLLIVASMVAIGLIIYFYRSHAMPQPLLRIAIGLLLGGAIGNLTDRLRTGAVVDFIDVGRWPIFNLADSSIVVGMFLMVALLYFGDKESRSDSGREGDASDDGDSVAG